MGDGATRYITEISVRNYGNGISSGVADVTFGQVFADGDVGAAQHVVAMAGGKRLPTQVDRKATWSDGSLRHGVITIQLAAPASGEARAVELYAAAGNADSGLNPVSLSDLLGSNFSARVRIKLDGTTYTADARDALAQVAQSANCPAWGEVSCKRWLAGGLASEWIVPAELTSGNRVAPRLRVYFNVRAYRGANGSVDNVRVDTVIENDLTYNVSPSNVAYDARLTVGQSSYSIENLEHYTQARWHRVLWSRGDPELYVQPSIEYLQKSRAISRYADLEPSEDFLDSRPQQAVPMRHLDQTPDMGATGAQPAIGPLPQWTSTFAVSGDRRAFNWMLANDDAVGSYGFHYRDAATGRPLRIDDHPYVTIADINHARHAGEAYQKDLLPSCSGDCGNPNRFNIAHQPSIGYLPYLVTGDFYYLEELQFEASYDQLWANPKYRRYGKGRLLQASLQVRGQAWELRTISNAAFATPDNDPMKSYFVDQINYIVQDYLDSYVDDPGHPLHTLDSYGAVHYPSGHHVKIPPWQADFFTWAVGHAAEQQVPGAKRLLNWLAPFQLGRMATADGGFCWLLASAYTLRVRDSDNSPLYTSLDQVYKASFPNLVGLKCNSQAMINELNSGGGHRQIGEMDGFPTSPTGFPANFQIGLAAAVDSNADNTDEAWRRFANRSAKPDYANYANFAVVPRSVN
ncbi:hypothetical protein [Salinisphaera sp.]|uniref:RIFT barrel domain-containing protein n=1 Tax=Salinisphaera sp. TaxID=1914330 RepID=UPI002D78AD0D|nr:hypothetical protein [Salinisphaera sp.]HET7313006.1 hypothetical protein [Salinisphaera sp.]